MESELAFKQHARRAYESGRVLRALSRGVLVLPMLLVAQFSHRSPLELALAASALFILIVLASIRGGSAGRAVPVALLAGLAPLLLPLGTRAAGQLACSEACMSFCLPACYLGGAVAGAALFLFARAEESTAARREFLIAALVMTGVTGALGCSMVGAGGVLGMFAAELMVSAPAWRTAT